MEVLNNVNKMRLSPVLVAAVTWATLGLPHSASASFEPENKQTEPAVANDLSHEQEFASTNAVPEQDRRDIGLTPHSSHTETGVTNEISVKAQFAIADRSLLTASFDSDLNMAVPNDKFIQERQDLLTIAHKSHTVGYLGGLKILPSHESVTETAQTLKDTSSSSSHHSPSSNGDEDLSSKFKNQDSGAKAGNIVPIESLSGAALNIGPPNEALLWSHLPATPQLQAQATGQNSSTVALTQQSQRTDETPPSENPSSEEQPSRQPTQQSEPAQETQQNENSSSEEQPSRQPTQQSEPAQETQQNENRDREPITPRTVQPTPVTPPAQGVPPQGTPAPEQETPDRLQLDLTPGRGTPELDLNIPERAPSAPPINAQPSEAPAVDPRVLVAEVVVSGAEGRLQEIVYDAIRTRPGRTTTRSQLQEDINAIFATGYFSNVRAEPSDTALGVRVTFVVEPNPVLRSVQVEGNRVLPQSVVQEIFSPQYNNTLNFRTLQEAIKRLEQWYKDKGYVLAQVVDTQVSPEGTVTLSVAEGVVESIQVRFLNKEGETTNEQGQPIRGRTRAYIVTRELALKPGQVFNRNEVQKDLQRVFRLGLFEDVQLSLNPGQDPRQVNVIVNVKERNSGSIAAGAGFSSASGLFGTVSYQEQNLGGNNQKIGTEVQLGQRELLFDVRFTDPWIGGDPYRTSYTVNFFRRRSISLIFDGGDPEVRLPNDDRPRILRLGGGVTFNRPLSRNPLADSEWVASLGLQYQRVSIRDRDGDISPVDELGNDLSFSGEGKDDLVLVQLGVVRDRRNNPLRTTSGSLLRFGLEQSVPIGLGNVFLTRLRGSYSYFVPVRFTSFTPGPQALAFNLQAGTVLNDLPPYEAFSLGGTNSVRGYDEGDLGSGRSYFQATAEYRFPVFSIIGGALFVDFGTDLGTGGSVPGDPAGVRGKPGTGFGYGIGVRIQSPLGPIRVDYGLNDDGDSRIHFGIGERF
ncbi:BamA/TamA family outer membrane protein [Aerosakkonema sp. BLCC-F183]